MSLDEVKELQARPSLAQRCPNEKHYGHRLHDYVAKATAAMAL